MNRRYFLKNSSMAGLSLNFIQSNEKSSQELTAFSLEEATLEGLQDLMQKGKLTAVQLTEFYLKRIASLDKSGPKLNAIIELNPDARAIAAEADKERKAGKVKSILHGIPVLIKDNINTGDKMQTTAGALALAGNHATNDAFIIARLRKAGAILLGKTNLSEWANFRSTNSSSGWSSRGGQTKNPYILDHNPCGSSSGSGSAVAANLCAVAIGTETDGSITCPASVANIVGIKPTVGLWSRSGIIPISSTQDTAGPMGRTVKDVALFLGLLTGIDEKDPLTKESQIHLGKDYTKHLSLDALKGKSIGIDMKKSSNHNINRLLLSNIQVLEKLGATVVPVEYSTKFEALGKYESEILRTEFKEGVNAYLSSAHLSIKNLKDVIEFNIKNEDLAMPYFKQEILEACEKKTGLNSTDYLQALTKGRDESRKIILDLMQEHQLDGFAGITMGPACSIDVMYGDRWGDDFITQPPAMSGFPHVTVPGGWIHNLPVGFSFFAEPYSEAKILGLAYAFEQTTKHRKKPTYKPSFLD